MKLLQEMPRKGVVYNYAFTPHFKTGYMSVDFLMPLTRENATGMSLLAGVLSRGSKKFPGMDRISRYLAKNYGAALSIDAGKAGEMEHLCLIFSFLNSEYTIDGEDICAAMIDLFRSIIFEPLTEGEAFKADFVEQEKKNLADKITGLFNDKRVWALERCKSLMCKGEAYEIGGNGDLETLEGFDAQKLYSFFQKILREAWIVCSYVGKDQGRFLDQLAAEFPARETEMPTAEIVGFSGKIKEIEEPMDLNQSKLTLGFRLGEASLKNRAACRLFNVLYGGSANSKLFMNVREKLSLCYYCSSRLDRLKNVMFVTSGIEADKYELARGEIEAQLRAIVEGAFTDEEMENARAYLIDSFRAFHDSQNSLAAMMMTGTLMGEIKTPEQEIEETQKITRADLVAIAKDIKLDTVYFLKGVHHEGE